MLMKTTMETARAKEKLVNFTICEKNGEKSCKCNSQHGFQFLEGLPLYESYYSFIIPELVGLNYFSLMGYVIIVIER